MAVSMRALVGIFSVSCGNNNQGLTVDMTGGTWEKFQNLKDLADGLVFC